MTMRLHANRRSLWVASWIIGLGLFALVIKRAGISMLLAQLRHLGWSFGLLILLSGGRHILRTAAWFACLTSEELKPRFLRLFEIRLIGDAATDLTLAGPLLGEGLKVWLASAQIPTAYSLSSVVLENLMYALAASYFILSGLAIALLTGVGSRELTVFVIACAVMLILFILSLFYLLRRRQRVLTRILTWSKQRYLTWPWRERHEETLKRFEESVEDFYHNHRRLFYYVFIGEMATNFTGVAEAYVILKATSGHESFLAAYLLEALNRIVTIAFAFIPLRLGVDEGSTALMMSALGSRAVDGVSLALARKLRTIVWLSLGLYLMPQHIVPRQSKAA